MNLPRWWWWLLAATCCLLVAVGVGSPSQLPVVGYKVTLIAVAVTIAVVVDRLFYKADKKDTPNANLSRALVFLAIMLALALGL